MKMPAEKIDRWYETFAEAQDGVAEAQTAMGYALYHGIDGFEKNTAKAAEWYTLAAKQGHVEAQYALAELHAACADHLDHSKAEYWYERASHNGHEAARERLEEMKGTEVEKRLQKAAERAESGDAASQHALGRYYLTSGPLKNVNLARFWFTKAADQNHAQAQYELGELYALEEEIHDLLRARGWYARAARQGHAKAADRLEVIDLCLRERGARQTERSPSRRSRKSRHALARVLVSLWHALDASNFVAAYSLMSKLKAGHEG